MLETIRKKLYETYSPDEKKWVFLSCFNESKQLLFSHGIVNADQALRITLESLYQTYVADYLGEISYIAVDVVAEIIEVVDPKDLPTFSPEEFGFAILDLEDDKSWVILPNTSGADDVKAVLFDLKQKYGIHGRAEIYAFRTQRILFAKW